MELPSGWYYWGCPGALEGWYPWGCAGGTWGLVVVDLHWDALDHPAARGWGFHGAFPAQSGVQVLLGVGTAWQQCCPVGTWGLR